MSPRCACAACLEKLQAGSCLEGTTGTRRGGRVVDRAALEMRSTRKGTGGSNPSLSATNKLILNAFSCFEVGSKLCP